MTGDIRKPLSFHSYSSTRCSTAACSPSSSSSPPSYSHPSVDKNYYGGSSRKVLLDWSDELYIHLNKYHLNPPPFNDLLRDFFLQFSKENENPLTRDKEENLKISSGKSSSQDEKVQEGGEKISILLSQDQEKKDVKEERRKNKEDQFIAALLESLDFTLQQLEKERSLQVLQEDILYRRASDWKLQETSLKLAQERESHNRRLLSTIQNSIKRAETAKDEKLRKIKSHLDAALLQNRGLKGILRHMKCRLHEKEILYDKLRVKLTRLLKKTQKETKRISPFSSSLLRLPSSSYSVDATEAREHRRPSSSLPSCLASSQRNSLVPPRKDLSFSPSSSSSSSSLSVWKSRSKDSSSLPSVFSKIEPFLDTKRKKDPLGERRRRGEISKGEDREGERCNCRWKEKTKGEEEERSIDRRERKERCSFSCLSSSSPLYEDRRRQEKEERIKRVQKSEDRRGKEKTERRRNVHLEEEEDWLEEVLRTGKRLIPDFCKEEDKEEREDFLDIHELLEKKKKRDSQEADPLLNAFKATLLL
ncbi:hypothetical protein CSUI_010457 [Cystoisospora suis]|uniref:Uncharacterized protein n=1 Tax=Cystoisospora suis TaxID=483139 RepID=A0A2C6JXV2_9APIC|nr:hypothetical protein CSUI_010457 [Cystoisospora suis]